MASGGLMKEDDDDSAAFSSILSLPITAYFPVVPSRQIGIGQKRLRSTKITDYFPHLTFCQNGRTASKSFLDLPAELRVWIYEYALPLRRAHSEDMVTEVGPCSKSAHEVCALEGRMECLGLVENTRGYTALLVTCKKIYGEAVDVLYSPVRSHNQSNSTKMQLRISPKEITIRGYGMFCSTHFKYREGSAVLFAKIRYLAIHILACRDEWWEPEDSYDDEAEEYDENLDRVLDMAQCRGNIHWAVTQLQTAIQLSTLALAVQWAEPLEYVWKPVFMDELEQYLEPLKYLRDISNVRILTLGVNYEDFSEQVSELKCYKCWMIRMMSGQSTVREPPIPFNAWNKFMNVLRHMRASCHPSWKREIEDILAQVAFSFCYDEVEKFHMMRKSAYSIWKQDKDKWGIPVEAILKVMVVEVPFLVEPHYIEGPEFLAEDVDGQLTSEEE
ncbi:hypothetical protein SLS56_011634 [Neofusicoccum ribis]|uniref:DUF7730 domain-containing protein n=1 Tax=Neofusicoccum ribis TaxID=45134 RepID=A0ABR3SBQ7_9PEZI